MLLLYRLSTVREADEILVMKEGRVVERGSHTQLLQMQSTHYFLQTPTGILGT